MSRAIPAPTVIYEVVPDVFDVEGTDVPLRAIARRLDHLTELSVDGLSLSPIMKGHDRLRVHTVDGHTIDPALGTADDLRHLVAEARERGIGVYMTGVFDHVSSEHPWFQYARAHGDDESAFPPEQRTRRFFTFSDDEPFGYTSRDGDAQTPELDLKNPDVRRRIFTSEESVLHHWLSFGVAGVRVLRADAVGYSILRECRRGTLTFTGDQLLVGDIRGFADRYVKDGLLDAVINHYLREAIVSYLRGQIPARQLARVLRDLSSSYGRALSRSWNVLSGYDTPRIRHVLGEDLRTRLAVLLGYTLPGAAHIFSGDEIGLEGKSNVEHIAPMRWDRTRWDGAHHALHVALGRIRRTQKALTEGEFVDLTPEGEDEILAFARVTRDPRETVICAINRASQTRVRKLFAPVCDLPDGLHLKDVLVGDGALVRSGTVTLEILGQDARILVPDSSDPKGARFFRGY
jgi:glycosidase